MGFTPPILIARLPSASAAFKQILEDSLPELEVLAGAHELPGQPNPTRDLLEAVETTLDPVHGGALVTFFAVSRRYSVPHEWEKEEDMTEPRQLSPDGKWWWDGSKWQPVEQPPEQPPQPPPQPAPPQPPPGKGRRWPLFAAVGCGGALALLVILIVIGSLAGVNSTSSTQTTSTQAPKATPAATAKATAPPGREGGCSPQLCANDNYGWIVVVSDVKYDAPSGNQFEKPEAGNVYVTMNVTFTTKLDSEQHANPTEFVLQDGSGIKHMITFMTACPSWSPVNVTKGATFGPKCLVFEAAAGKPSGLVLVWTPSGFGGGYNMKLS